MNVLVLGGGVIGITTAYFLARAGADVVLVERRDGLALETSFANAGQVSAGYAAPWAAPGLPLKALAWLLQRDSPLAIRPDGSLFQWQWIAQFLANCNAESYAVNKARMMRLAEYSRDCLRALRGELDLRYEARTGGTLQLFRRPGQLAAAGRDTELLARFGVPFRLLDEAGCMAVEPALRRVPGRVLGGLHLPNDETGDCYRFCQALAQRARELGVRFLLDARIERLLPDPGRGHGRVAGVEVTLDGRRERLTADHYVVALGCASRDLLLPLGLTLPVCPVKGYSLTLPISDVAGAPLSTVLDETCKVAITRFDTRLRIGGMAELCGHDLTLRPERRAALERVLRTLFPYAGNLRQGEFWAGLRPMTPDGTPLVGATPISNLSLNTGHGTLGWTMACGSARLLADSLTGQRPEIDREGLTLARYGRREPAWGSGVMVPGVRQGGAG